MPSGKTLGIGLGIKRGTQSFLNSFYQAKQFELQEKHMKNGVILQALMSQLQDDDVPLFERAKILDAIPNLVGAKLDVPLSQMLKLDEYNEQLVEDEPAQKGQQGQKGNVLSSNQTGSPNEGQTLQMQGTQGTQDVPATQTKRGNLTPNELRSKLIIAQKKAVDEDDIEKQSKLLTLQYTLQREILGKGGYTQPLPATFDEDGNLLVRFMRPADGEITTKNLGKVTTEALKKAGIQNQYPKGNLGQLMQAREITEAAKVDPTAYPEAQVKAAQDLLANFDLTGTLKREQVEALRQGNTGTKPISPAQSADDVRANQNMQIQLQTSFDTAQQNAIQSSERAASSAQEATNQWNSVVKPLQDQMNAAFNEADGDTTDEDYLKAQKAYNIARTSWENGVKKSADLANATDLRNKAALSNAERRLSEFGKTGKVSGQKWDAKVQAAIDTVRRNNPEKTANMSDDEIYNYLVQKGKIK